MEVQEEDMSQQRLEYAKQFLLALENGDEQIADDLLEHLSHLRETCLFQEVGKLTRQLHEAIAGFSMDPKIADLTEKEIPDAKERLNYVITMTQQSADTTLNVVETLLPLSEQMSSQTAELNEKWARFLRKEMEYDEFNNVSQELVNYFASSTANLAAFQSQLNEVLLAQGFQDLTGQIIKRVINMVQDVEHSLVDLIRISGYRYSRGQNVQSNTSKQLEGPAVPAIIDDQTITDQDGVDDLLSSLGF